VNCFQLQAVPESSSAGRRPKKGQAAVDAWQPADVTKRNVGLHGYMAVLPYLRSSHDKLEDGVRANSTCTLHCAGAVS
jgi:hypothetical protein